MPPSPFPTASAQDTASTVSASSAHNIDKGAIAVAAATLAVNAVPAITKVITAANEVSGNDIAVETSLNDLSNAINSAPDCSDMSKASTEAKNSLIRDHKNAKDRLTSQKAAQEACQTSAVTHVKTTAAHVLSGKVGKMADDNQCLANTLRNSSVEARKSHEANSKRTNAAAGGIQSGAGQGTLQSGPSTLASASSNRQASSGAPTPARTGPSSPVRTTAMVPATSSSLSSLPATAVGPALAPASGSAAAPPSASAPAPAAGSAAALVRLQGSASGLAQTSVRVSGPSVAPRSASLPTSGSVSAHASAPTSASAASAMFPASSGSLART